MQRLFLALSLFALLIWGSLWSSRTVEATVDAIVQDMESGRLEQAYEKWSAAQTLLGSLLLHEELDEVNRLFARVRTAQKEQITDDLLLDRTELLAQLRHLPHLEQPNLKNLF